MRLVSFQSVNGNAYGFVVDGSVLPASEIARQRWPDLKSVLAADAVTELRTLVGPALALEELTLLSPIPNPDKILCVGLNYAAHIKETGRAKPDYPSIFTRYPSSVVGHNQPLVRPHVSKEFDYEGELAVVIGRRGRYIKAADALSHVAGYSCFNDGSIRDYQIHTSQFWPGKSFDKTGSMGPWLVTPDDLPAIDNQSLKTLVNGEVVQSTPIDDLAFSIADIIEYASRVTELLPGDVIATGTPGGVGKFRTPPLYLFAGDRVDVEISGVGTLSNRVVDEA